MVSYIFKVNNNDIRTMSGASFVDFEHISHLFYCYYSWIRKNKCSGIWETIAADNKFVFSNCEKYIVLHAGKNCWAACFHSYSPYIRLWKNKFSQQRFQKSADKWLKIIMDEKSNISEMVYDMV